MAYHVYTRINAHVGWSDERLLDAFDSWAEKHIKPSAPIDAVLRLRTAVLAEHHDAQNLFREMRF